MPGSRRRLAAVTFIIRSRTDRNRYFPSNLFSEPAWDFLLNLYAAAVSDETLTASALAKAGMIPRSTADRWVSVLEQAGLVERKSRRGREFVLLTDEGWLAMDSYFEGMSTIQI